MNTTPFVVTSPKQLLVIASPGREEIMDAVGLLGPSTVAEIAQFLGRSRHGLYYHVRVLQECGLLLEEPSTGGAARYDVPGRPLSVRFDIGTARTRQAVVALARSRLRSALRGFVRGCRPELAVADGAHRNLWVTHWKGWLSDDELAEVNVLFGRLVELFQHEGANGRAGRRAHEITFALAPIPPRAPTRMRSKRSAK
jgi:hypothetical protein